MMNKATEQQLTKLADAAFRQAAKKVIERAAMSGTPVIIWEDESLKQVQPQIARKHRMPPDRKDARVSTKD